MAKQEYILKIVDWENESNIILLGYWKHLWAHSYEAVTEIDTEKNIIWLKSPYNHYGFKENHPFRAMNLVSEIDSVGEWSYDYKTNKIYLLPPKNKMVHKYELSVCKDNIFDISNSSNITISGLQIKKGTSNGIKIINSSNISIEDCLISGFSRDGIILSGGNNNKIIGCEIKEMGRGGIIAKGGDRKTLAPSNFLISGCNIHSLSRIDRTYTPGINAVGVGIEISNCTIHNIPSSAMRIDGNNHIIQYNEIYDVVTESDDQGAIDMWGDPTFRGNVFRYNYIHDIKPKIEASNLVAGRSGIRLDDAISGVKIYGNIFARCSYGHFGAIQIHGGKENSIYDNIFIECENGVSFTSWKKKKWKEYNNYRNTLKIISKIYLLAYPKLKKINSNLNSNLVENNIFLNCKNNALRKPIRAKFRNNRTIKNSKQYEDRDDIEEFLKSE